MRTNYPRAIRQDPAQLQESERPLRGTPLASRVRLLRLLKTGQARSLPEAADLLGYSTVQVTRWWACYRQRGLTGLLKKPTHPGRPSQLTTAAWRGLQQEMRAGRITPGWKTRGSICNLAGLFITPVSTGSGAFCGNVV